MNEEDEGLQDSIRRYMAADGNVRILLAHTTQSCEEARQVHEASPVATAAMGRTLTAALLLASEMKGDGSITTNVAGNGPMGRICAVARPDGTVKVTAADPTVALPPRADGKLDVAGAVGREGKLAVIRDLGMREPWVGQVNLTSGEIAEDFAMYLTVSEQQPSLVSLGVLIGRDRQVVSAGGIVVQPLPGCPEEVLATLENLAPALVDLSRGLQQEGPDGLVQSVFGGLNPALLDERPARLQCDCSRERISRALIALGVEELTDMSRQDDGAELQCHFCNVKYQFTADDLNALLVEASQR